jgi:outer membrane protein assembly factor BamB
VGTPTSTWPTYHGNTARTGDAGASVPALARPLRVAWRSRLDGAVYAEPILVGSTAVVATENDTVYALSVATGYVVWKRHVGSPVPLSSLPCGNIDPSGITGTPAYDKATGSVFAVAETAGAHHELVALNAANGTVRWRRSLDVLSGRQRSAQQERGAVLVVGNRAVVSFGGRYGDCGNYVGYVTSTPTSGAGPIATYAVPTSREAGIWAAPGPVLAGGKVYVATGNGAATGGRWDGSDSVVELDPVTMHRLSAFAPDGWQSDNAQDLDLGSMSPIPVAGRIVSAGKRGTAYLLPLSLRFGTPLAALPGCRAFGGAAVRGTLALLPCTSGVRALRVGATSLSWSWQAGGISGSPVLAGNAVYVLAPERGTFYELALSSGNVLGSLDLSAGITRFATPTVAYGGRLVLVPTMSGVVAIS